MVKICETLTSQKGKSGERSLQVKAKKEQLSSNVIEVQKKSLGEKQRTNREAINILKFIII